MRPSSFAILAACACCTSARALQEGGTPPGDAPAVIRGMVEYLAGVERAEFSYAVRWDTSAEGMRMEYWAGYDVSLEKPERLSLRQTGGMRTASVVTAEDGMYIYIPMGNRYVLAETPGDAADFIDQEADMYDFYWRLVAGPGLRTLLTSEPGALFEGYLESAEYVGRESVGDAPAHHVRAGDEGQTVDFWIAAEGAAPLLLQARCETPGEWVDEASFGETVSTITTTFTGWSAPETIPGERFTFEPPEGAEEAGTIDEAYLGDESMDWEEPGQVELVGQDAPRFELEMLGGGTLDLDRAIRENKVVVLDFWATWCPPCRKGLPVLDEVAREQRENGVAIFAVNVQEDAETVQEFVDSEELGLAVALDEDGSVSQEYGVSGIPQTVVIDRDGRIRAVHVGFSEDLKEELEKEIKASLAGEEIEIGGDLEGPAELPEAENLEQVWSLAGAWESVFVGESGEIVACGGRGFGSSQIARIGSDGQTESIIDTRARAQVAIPVQLDADDEREYIVSGIWGAAAAIDADGSTLWSAPRGDGVDDVWGADLTGDGIAEVIIGYNGFTGLYALSPDGKPLWRDNSIGNVWHVTALDLEGDGRPEVIATSAVGKVHVFDGAEGEPRADMNAGVYTNLVRPATLGGEALVLAAGGGLSDDATIVCLAQSGDQRWRFLVEGHGRAEWMSASKARPWGAVALDDGLVCVFSLEDGRILARTVVGGTAPAVAWHDGGDEPRLLVATGSELVAMRVVLPSE